MNHFPDATLTNPVDVLLAEVAIHVQLSPTQYATAVQRYKTLDEWIQREGSPLHGLVQRSYAQGSMAIGTPITSRMTDDEFDIDVMSQLALPLQTPAKQVLDLLCSAIKGEPHSRYYDKTRRRTRCATVSYADGMHVDITPAVLQYDTPPRQSWIFDHPPQTPTTEGSRLTANPFGFAQWFNERTPRNRAFAQAFFKRAVDRERLVLKAMDAAEPVPPQEPPQVKSATVVALQLLKRWRNVQYDKHEGRRPPSVLLSKLVADAASQERYSLADTLLHQAQYVLCEMWSAHEDNRCIYVQSPACPDDELTDRWPGGLTEQAVFIRHLRQLIRQLERLMGDVDLKEMLTIMTDLFGESPTRGVFEDFNRQQGRTIQTGRSRYLGGVGSLIVGSVAGSSSPAHGRRATRQTFHGDGKE